MTDCAVLFIWKLMSGLVSHNIDDGVCCTRILMSGFVTHMLLTALRKY